MKFLLLAVLIAICCARPHSDEGEDIAVRFREVRGADDGELLPATFSVTLEHNRRDVDLPAVLDLVRNDKVHQIEFSENNEPVESDLHDVAFYQDRSRHAAITAKVVRQVDSPVRMLRGSFVINDVTFEIEPVDPASEAEAKRDLSLDGHDHVIRKVSDATAHVSTVPPPVEPMDMANISRRASEQFDVEVFWVSDYQMYLEWNKIKGHSSYNLHEFFAHQANGMDLVYSSFSGIGLTVNVWIVKVNIFTKPSSLPTDLSKFPGRKNPDNQNKQSINATLVLEKMGTYREKMGYTWYNPDHLMTWTGFDLDGSTVGLAYLCRVCQGNSGVSTVEYVGWHSWGVAAHELGHNLGMSHDGEGLCASTEHNGNIMSPTLIRLDTMDDVSQAYRFSTCTMNQARACFKGTNKDKFPRICLKSTSCTGHYDQNLDKLPGQIDSLNKQCEEQFGAGSKTDPNCEGFVKDSDVCEKMMCLKDGRCWSGRPTDGTSCGEGKWCIQGKCVSNRTHPKVIRKNCSTGKSLPRVPAGCKDTHKDCPAVFSNPGPNCDVFKDVCCKTCTAYGLPA